MHCLCAERICISHHQENRLCPRPGRVPMLRQFNQPGVRPYHPLFMRRQQRDAQYPIAVQALQPQQIEQLYL